MFLSTTYNTKCMSLLIYVIVVDKVFYWNFIVFIYLFMTCFLQENNSFETQIWSQRSPQISWSQLQFGLHSPSLGWRILTTFSYCNYACVEVVGSQVPQNVEGSRDLIMKERHTRLLGKKTTIVRRRMYDFGFNWKEHWKKLKTNKKMKIDEIELEFWNWKQGLY